MNVLGPIVSLQKNPNPSALSAARSPARFGANVMLYVIEFITILPVPQERFWEVMFQLYLVVALIEYTFSCMSGMVYSQSVELTSVNCMSSRLIDIVVAFVY